MARSQKEYDLYQNGKIMCSGTKREISSRIGTTVGALKNYADSTRSGRKMYFLVTKGHSIDKTDNKVDCFAYTGNKNEPCDALTVTVCDKDNCKFYKKV